jgi:hypothetical protein
VQPCNLTLNTANGTSTTAIKGLAHVNFFMTSDKKQKVPLCTTFIVTSQLNGLQAILGSKILMNPEKVKSLSPKCLTITSGDQDFTIPIQFLTC